MWTKSLLGVITLIALASSSPVNSLHVIHEKRDHIPHGWIRGDALDESALLPMKIGLAQENLDKGYEWLMSVSHPDSKNYGKHWTADEIVTAFAPTNETVDAVKAWLLSAGIGNNRIEQSGSRGWLNFRASVAEAEELLKTKYYLYEHEETGQPHAACEEYSVPSHLKERIDFITPTVHFDARIKARGQSEDDFEKRAVNPGRNKGHGGPGAGGSGPKRGRWNFPQSDIIKQLKDCDQQITPWCLRVLYRFPPGFSSNPKNSFGIVEYTPQAYVPSDLDLFFKNFSTRQVGNRPILESLDGGVVQQSQMSFGLNGESDLDLEYAMTLVYPQKVTLYQVGDLVEGASFNDFLDGIDASYCTYAGGDDPNQDATYPDPNGGYQGPKDCGKYAPTKVISTSYAYNEHDLTPAYEQRQCYEYMKLGMNGVSVLYSSGDNGVSGNGGQCIDSNGNYQDGSLGGRFNPSFPSVCPFVTSVGATQVIPGTNILATRTEPEQACQTVIYSGGGFSDVFPLPDYQANAVHSWFRNNPPPYGADRFNNSQMTRGFPDISANGANYVIAVDGVWALVYGTSASAPTLGSIFTLINEARFNAGKGSIGFINPVAYAHPEAFNDITQGGNQGCATAGFQSAPGWDPVTGLGTPRFPRLRSIFLSLP